MLNATLWGVAAALGGFVASLHRTHRAGLLLYTALSFVLLIEDTFQTKVLVENRSGRCPSWPGTRCQDSCAPGCCARHVPGRPAGRYSRPACCSRSRSFSTKRAASAASGSPTNYVPHPARVRPDARGKRGVGLRARAAAPAPRPGRRAGGDRLNRGPGAGSSARTQQSADPTVVGSKPPAGRNLRRQRRIDTPPASRWPVEHAATDASSGS
jgi:hypothetical protein